MPPLATAPPTLAAAGFETFSVQHWLALLVFVAGLPLVVLLGRLPLDQRLVARVFAVAICCFTVPMQLVDFLPGNFSFTTTLPLQLCDLAWVFAVVALWTGRRLPVAVTFYWGLVLSIQGLLTPSLEATWPDPKFIGFWGMHYLIVWSAVYLTWGRRLRPDWAGYRATVALTFAWLVAVFCFNAVAGTNYGFVNRKPSSASALDYLGPWPFYVLVEIVVIATVWALMTWPFARAAAADDAVRAG